MVGTLAGLSAVIAGMASLRLAWRGQSAWRPYLIITGWALLALALFAFSLAIGGETGIPLAIILISLAGLAAVMGNRELRPRKTAREREGVIDRSRDLQSPRTSFWSKRKPLQTKAFVLQPSPMKGRLIRQRK